MKNTSEEMFEFPAQVDKITRVIAEEFNLLLWSNTHYDTENRVLVWYEKNNKKRIDLTFLGDSISVTFYYNIYPFCPKFIDWCHGHSAL